MVVDRMIRAAGWLAFAVALAAAPLAVAQDLAKQAAERQMTQPLNNAPVWREVRSGQAQTTSLPGRETAVLIQSEGQTWRSLRVPIATAGGWLIAGVLVILFLFYAWRGSIKTHAPLTGRKIERFSPVERLAHWSMGISFAVLGVTGLVITFGKAVLLPLIGYTLFSWLATLSKTLHNFIGPVFTVALPVFILVYIRNNIPRDYDMKWIARFGGMLDRSGKSHPPSGKFNAGEKFLFWILVCALGITLAVTGLILNFPNFDQTRQTMQNANVIHMIAGLVGIALAFGHIYLGTIGMKGAFDAMRYGYVDETWAKEHHEYWYNDVVSGKVAARRPEMPGAVQGQRA